MIAFLDACVLIYLIEGSEPFSTQVRDQLSNITRENPDVKVALSRLSWLECRVGPMKVQNSPVLAQYDAFFMRPDLVWVELTRDVVELAAALRASYGLRTPDALQAASCLQLGSEHLLLSGDAAFQRVQGLRMAKIG